MKNKVGLSIVFMLLSLNVIATPEEEEKQFELQYQNEKHLGEEKIPAIVGQYALSFGCAFHMEKGNVVELKAWKETSYLALYSLDLGCSGGSAMSRPYFVVLSNFDRSHPRNIFVNPKYSLPSQTSESFPSHVEAIYLADEKLKYKALKYGFSKDPLSSPSVVVTGEVEFKNSIWQPKPDEK